MKTLVFTCAHADPDVSNERFDWLGKLIYDEKPDMVIDLGDGADMHSLNSYDGPYPKNIMDASSYEEDVENYNDAQERLRYWAYKRSRVKKPTWIGFEGNHENRIKKAVALDPRREGEKYGVSFRHLQTNRWFDEYHEYEHSSPSVAHYDGVSYAHYFTAGAFSRAMSGVHHAYSLVQHRFNSATCGHSHKRSMYFKDSAYPNPVIGAVVGNFKGAKESWAGQANDEWWSGVLIKNNVEDGVYDPQWVSLTAMEREYS